MNTIQQLESLLKIEDAQTRKDAVLSWWGTLSESERAEVKTYLRDLVDKVALIFHSVVEALGVIGERLRDWFAANPELKIYLEALAREKEESHLT